MNQPSMHTFDTIRYTTHAQHRQATRNLSNDDILFVYAHGRRVRCAGAVHVFLGWRDIPADRETYRRYGHLEGTTLVMDDGADTAVLITAYRNRRGFKKIRSKTKFER